MTKSIAIIGAGIGGLSAGCYARMNGYPTTIFEMHNRPGGVCTSWTRKGYTFDGCIHHLAGCAPGSRTYRMWEELGALPKTSFLYPEDLVQVEGPGGETLKVYIDLDRLEEHMKKLAPRDVKAIGEYIDAARRFATFDMMDIIAGKKRDWIGMLPHLPAVMKWNRVTMQRYAERFSDPFLRRVFPMLQYDSPQTPVGAHLNMLAGCQRRFFGWPAGGSLAFAQAIERRYLDLGGDIVYRTRVDKILVKDDFAVGVRLEDGSEYLADIIISNANGKKAIFDMLDGIYASRRIRSFYSRPVDRIGMGVHVSLGAARDLSPEPHALVLLLERPVKIAGEERDRLDLELFGFDPSMAPQGKGTLKAVLSTSYAFWKDLYQDRERYKAEKQDVADKVIDLLQARFPGLREEIEVVDVATPMTTERYTGNAVSYEITPLAMLRALFSSRGLSLILPGLENFYMVGQWAGFPSIPNVAAMGRNAIRSICRDDWRYFETSVS